MNTQSKVKLLKENNEDFEFYPTTNEILDKIAEDINYVTTTCETIYNKRIDDKLFKFKKVKSKIKREINYNRETEKHYYNTTIDSFIDIGAGDGRVLNHFKDNIRIKNKLGIELAEAQSIDLIRNNVKLIGRDFFETILIDKSFDICFSNPPYSMFKAWCEKIVKEVNASYIYLVIPERWKDDFNFKKLLEEKGDLEVLGSYSFTDGDREARAKVDLIRIQQIKDNDVFSKWVNDNISEFKSDTIDLKIDEKIKNAVINHKKDLVNILIDNYNNELSILIDTYQKLGSIDFNIIEQLGINKTDVINKIKLDITNLKNKYWKTSFSLLTEIVDRLIFSKREQILKDITWFKELDFNFNNIKTIIIWIIENHNAHSKEQLESVYDKLTNLETVKPYKSNENWVKDNWRYNKDVPTKYSLDYRTVVHFRMSEYGFEIYRNNLVYDLCIIADSLGFNIENKPAEKINYELSKAHSVFHKDIVLFEYRIYQNGNIHFKLNQEFLKVFNIEAGKLKGWLKSPKDVKEEFNLSDEESKDYFKNSKIKLLNNKSRLLLN